MAEKTALWAWKPKANVKWKENNGWNVDIENPTLARLKVLRTDFPAALLHYFCLTPKTVLKKMRFYRRSGQVPNMKHPLHTCGPKEPLPEWAVL